MPGITGVAGAQVPPAGGEREVVADHVVTHHLGGDGDIRQLWAQVPGGHPRHWSLRVQKRCQLPAPGGGDAQLVGSSGIVAVGPAGQWDAGPLHAQRAGVGLAVGRVVQHRQRVVEQVLDSQPRPVQVRLRRRRQVGTALLSTAVQQKQPLFP